MQPNRNDHMLSVTRITAAIIVPMLLIACVILFFFPHKSARYFAFPVQPTLIAISVGAGYVGVESLALWHLLFLIGPFPIGRSFVGGRSGTGMW